MPRSGPKRKRNVKRYKSGQITHKERRRLKEETEREIKAPAIAARARHTGLKEDKAADPLAVTPYGILFLQGELDTEQRDAATAYQEITTRAYLMKGLPVPHLRSAAAAWMSIQSGSSADPDPEAIQAAWEKYHTVTDVLLATGKVKGTTGGVPDHQACKRIVHQLCFVMDRNIQYRPLSDEELDNLNFGLNAIHTALWKA